MACTLHFCHCHCCRVCISRLANSCLCEKQTMKGTGLTSVQEWFEVVACPDLCGKFFILTDDIQVVSCCKQLDDWCAMSKLLRSCVGSTWSTWNSIWVSTLLLFSSMCPFCVPPLVHPQICLLCVSVSILYEVCTACGSTITCTSHP